MAIEIIFLALFILPIGRIKRGLKGLEKPVDTVKYGTLFSILGVFLIFAVMFFMGDSIGVSVHDEILQLAGVLSENSQFIKSMGIEGLSKTDRIAAIAEIYGVLEKVFPAVICITAGIFSFVEYNLFVRFVTKGDFRPYAFIKDFTLEIQAWMSWVIMYFASFLIKLMGYNIGEILGDNINLIISAPLVMQGLSFMFYSAEKKKIDKKIPIILTVLMIVIPHGKMPFYILGIADIIFNLRNRLKI